MTLVQLAYIVAIDTHRHFATAAASCFITQPTLSMQLQKLEEELGVKLFDRSRQPVVPTPAGVRVVSQAKRVLFEANRLKELVAEDSERISGPLKLGIIPTLAPYLLPLFVQPFMEKHPEVQLRIWEENTEQLRDHLKNGKLDLALLVSPLEDTDLSFETVFYEELMVYLSRENCLLKKDNIDMKDIDVSKVQLLNETHCLRSQVLQLCQLRHKDQAAMGSTGLEYEAGSIETLKKLVELNGGITFLPELAVNDLSKRERGQVRNFSQPVPLREVSLVSHRNFTKKRLFNALYASIVESIPEKIRIRVGENVLPANQ